MLAPAEYEPRASTADNSMMAHLQKRCLPGHIPYLRVLAERQRKGCPRAPLASAHSDISQAKVAYGLAHIGPPPDPDVYVPT